MRKKDIPIVLTFDDNYLNPALVACYSILKNANKSNNYQFLIPYINNNLSSSSRSKLRYLIKMFDNATIEFLSISSEFYDRAWIDLKNKYHFSEEIFVKLFFASIFKHYDKVIYTDVDVIFTGDISEAWKYNIDKYYLAGCRSLEFCQCSKYVPSFINKQAFSNYVGAGFLVFNLTKIREDRMEERLLHNVNKYLNDIIQPEQDILNYTFYGKIYFLPTKFLFCTYLYDFQKKYPNEKELHEKPIQIHYAGTKKPWKSIKCKKALLWYRYYLFYKVDNLLNKIKNIIKFKKMIYFNAGMNNNNFGDILNTYILNKLCNNSIYKKSTGNQYQCNFVVIGSVLDQFFFKKQQSKHLERKKNVNVFGSGFISDFETLKIEKGYYVEEFWPKMKIFALRGYLSKNRCEKILNKTLDNIALGDPGLLVYKFFDFKKYTKDYDVGIVLHYVDKNNINIKNIQLERYNIKFIDITSGYYNVMQEIASCKVILSSAMHGLITADAFLIPNQWINLSDKVFGNGYKFFDYYSVFNINEPKPLDLTKQNISYNEIDYIINNYKIKQEQIETICNNLLKSFPL